MDKKWCPLWVHSHFGISWNEKADHLAKDISDYMPTIKWITIEDITSHLKKQSNLITSENYRKSKCQDLIGNFPNIFTISKWNKNRIQNRFIARIISAKQSQPKACYINIIRILCVSFAAKPTTSHLLLKCKKYGIYRNIL